MASTSSRKTSDTSVHDLLCRFLNDPPSTNGVTPAELLAIYSYLMEQPPDGNAFVHWFCPAADTLRREAAIFMIRVFAYSGDLTAKWKERLITCLHGCCACTRAFTKAKFTSRSTYFSAFSDITIKEFYEAFETWEIEVINRKLDDMRVLISTRGDLSDVPQTQAIVYHILSTVRALSNSRILSFIENQHNVTFTEFPVDPPAPGLFLLTLHRSADVRRWARDHLKNSKSMSADDVFGPYEEVIAAISTAISSASSFYLDGICSMNTEENLFETIFSESAEFLWSSLPNVIHKFPPECYLSTNTKYKATSIKGLVLGHLQDNATHFPHVLRCFMYLLQKVGKSLWIEESKGYPQVVFDSIKDNPAFLKYLLSSEIADDKPGFLMWYWDFLKSIWDTADFGEVLLKLVSFLCGETQHERFEKIRPVSMSICIRTLLAIIREKPDAIKQAYFRDVMEIHGVVFINVAFASDYSKPQWEEARLKASKLLQQVFGMDVSYLTTIIEQLANMVLNMENSRPPISHSIVLQMWKKSYETVQKGNDVAGLICLIAQIAHIDVLTVEAFAPPKSLERNFHQIFNSSVVAVNEALNSMRVGLLDCVTKYTNYNSPVSIMDLLRREEVIKSIVALMFSPVESLRASAQALVGRAFDADTRIECFHALLQNMPVPTMHGIHSFIITFNKYAASMPEACSVSQSLVRCMTDIIEALCERPDGLLLNERYLGLLNDASNSPSTASTLISDDLTKLWKLMTNSIAIIFKRTPHWANFFTNEHMVEWMRDALIFGRDMLAQRRVIESAAIALSTEPQKFLSSRKLSAIGRAMVDDLQRVLSELVKWLRLTDQELLHQSFALLQSLLDCFRETEVLPEPSAIVKLNKVIASGRSSKSKETQSTRLDLARLSKLEESLAAFDSKNRLEEDSGSVSETIDLTESPKMAKSALPAVSKTKVAPKMATQAAKVSENDKNKAIKVDSRSIPSTTSESEESDNEDDNQGKGGLKSLNKFQRSPRKMQQPRERRQIKLLDNPKSHKDAAVINRFKEREEAHRIAMRLKPDISSLHRSILSWNYGHLGKDPPFKHHSYKLFRVPDIFHDYTQYLHIFEPLLMYECWSQLTQSKEDRTIDIYDCRILARHFVDDYLDLDLSIPGSVKKDWFLSDADIVLLHRNEQCHILGKVVSYKPNQTGIQTELRCFLGHGRQDPGLQVNSQWKIKKVFSLSTINREYAALMALPYYDLFQYIIRPNLTLIPKLDPLDVRDVMRSYQVNEPQAYAILSAMKTDGFTLIQGPPGTGKTSTIRGLAGAFLSKRGGRPAIIQPGKNATQKSCPNKLLICAPSNAAIDEIAKRLSEGVRSQNGSVNIPKLVRIGADSTINISVKDFSVDALVDQKINSTPDAQKASESLTGEFAQLRAEMDAVKSRRQAAQDELANIHDNAVKTLALDQEINTLNSRRIALSQKLDALKDKQKSNNRTVDAIRRKYRLQVLDEADIICSTLAGAGHEILDQFDFETVIIDEAAQAIELSSLIPLRYRCKKCVMVGDPQQLPPTVISEEASKWGYNQSLFVRLQKQQPNAVHLLRIQYRMHPEISLLPSRLFYDSRLEDGPDMARKTAQPWHESKIFGVYKFFSVSRGKEEFNDKKSFYNMAECEVILALYERLRRQYSSYNFDFRVGIVSMYRAQLVQLRRKFEAKFGFEIKNKIDFNTVDGFQGQEKDIIILSCVRAGPGVNSVGFLADTRRINVAITRSRSSLFIVGHAQTLERSNNTWKEIVREARSRSTLQEVDTKDFMTPLTITTPAISTSRSPKKPGTPRGQVSDVIPFDLATPSQIRKGKAAQSTNITAVSGATMNDHRRVSTEVSDNNNMLKRVIDVTSVDEGGEQRPRKVQRTGEVPTNAHARKPRPKPAANLFIPKKSVAGPR